MEAYLKKEGNISIDEGIRRLETIYRKYKQVEQQLTEQKLRYCFLFGEECHLSFMLSSIQKCIHNLDLLNEPHFHQLKLHFCY